MVVTQACDKFLNKLLLDCSARSRTQVMSLCACHRVQRPSLSTGGGDAKQNVQTDSFNVQTYDHTKVQTASIMYTTFTLFPLTPL